MPVTWIPALEMTRSIANWTIGVLFAGIVLLGILRHGREAWITLPAALLFGLSLFSPELDLLHVQTVWTIRGMGIGLQQLARVALSAVLGIMILRRFQRSQRRKQQLEADLRQAQQLQQVLLPEAIPQIPGFRIQCEYRPAQEVGGDFFQVLETRDGGVLIVIGDVSGKGVPAAMLVAVIVGTLRTLAEETEDPRQILIRLNRRLCGRMQGGLVTCLCAQIAPDGSMTVASAGHLAPWLSTRESVGQEIDIPHDLPLGIKDDIEYALRHLRIPENSTMTFVSDCVIEAKNGHKELFGFERARALSTEPAAEIADAANQFGQQDDITVVTIQRMPAPAYA